MVYPGWAACSLEGQIGAMTACGLREAEIFTSEKTLAEAPDVARKLREAGVTPVSLHAPYSRSLSLSHLEKVRRLEAVASGQRAIQVAAKATVQIVLFHPADDLRNIALTGEHAAALTESMRTLCAAAEREGMRVVIENMPPGELGARVAEIAGLVKGSGIANLGVCLDTGHANMNGDLIEGVAASGERLFALHVHDNDGLKDQHLPVFAGTTNWGELVKALVSARFEGCFMLETGHLFPSQERPQPSWEWVERVRGLLMNRAHATE
jgi:sugar phosphate isomerase/epimerase